MISFAVVNEDVLAMLDSGSRIYIIIKSEEGEWRLKKTLYFE